MKKILKNLFGNGSKIHVDEIATDLKIDGVWKLLGFCIIAGFGSNENGSYVKFGNGFMICWHRFTEISAPDKVFEGGFSNAEREISLPETYKYPPLTFVGNLFGGRFGTVTNQKLSSFHYSIYALRSSNVPATSFFLSVGMWK